MKYYRLKDSCSEYDYVFVDTTVKTHRLFFSKNELLTDENEKPLTDIIEFTDSLDEILESDYLECIQITEEEYWRGIYDGYIKYLEEERYYLNQSIEILK